MNNSLEMTTTYQMQFSNCFDDNPLPHKSLNQFRNFELFSISPMLGDKCDIIISQ